MKAFHLHSAIKCALIIMLLLQNNYIKSQSLFDGWDFDRAFYDSDEGNYILIHHKASFNPPAFEYYDYTSIWEVSTGNLMNTLFEKYNQYKLKTGKQFVTYSDGGDWYDKINTRIDPKQANGTYIKLNNNTVEVYDAATNTLKYIIHPAEAFRKNDYSGKAATVSTYASRCIEEQKAKGFSLISRFDTLLLPAKNQLLNLNRKGTKSLSDKADCTVYILTPEDSLLSYATKPIPGNENFIYLDSTLTTENNISAYNLLYAGNIKDVQVNFSYAYSTATMPVTVLLFSNPNGPVTAARKKAYNDSVGAVAAAIKDLATIRALVKTRMIPGEKLLIDTAIIMKPGNYNQTIINAEFDEKLNRTLYIGVKDSAADIEINTVYTYKFVTLPSESTKTFNSNGFRLYRVSFTGPINAFDIVHDVAQNPATIYMFLTKRPDEKGYAANKKVVDEWNGIFAERDAALEKKGKEKNKQYEAFAGIAREFTTRMKRIYESAKYNNSKLHAFTTPSPTEIDGIIKDLENTYKGLKNYILDNESKIKSVVATNTAYAAFIKKQMDAFMNIRSDFNRIDDTVKTYNDSGGKINIGNLWAAFLGIQETAYKASESSF